MNALRCLKPKRPRSLLKQNFIVLSSNRCKDTLKSMLLWAVWLASRISLQLNVAKSAWTPQSTVAKAWGTIRPINALLSIRLGNTYLCIAQIKKSVCIWGNSLRGFPLSIGKLWRLKSKDLQPSSLTMRHLWKCLKSVSFPEKSIRLKSEQN